MQEEKAAVKIFVSYSHQDEAYREELVNHLAVLRRQGVIHLWHDRMIAPGADWAGEIDNKLLEADIVILLVSSDFLASDYCYDNEMKKALELHRSGQMRVVPIIVRSCDWTAAPIGELQALPRDARPVSNWNRADDAWLDVIKSLRSLATRPPGHLTHGYNKEDFKTENRTHMTRRAVTVNGVRQVMEWIEPGSFLMGSPEDEPGRYPNETQHSVTLTQGFWLGTTACSQAFWKAVMGENPSSFKDPQKPVESVSWGDVQGFLKKLNSLYPTLGARLPSEAEWEYACRAGTTTAFSFGNDLTPELANYQFKRGETISVEDLDPNPWGLHQMHGNVLEWCQDWYGDYPSGEQVDPTGPDSGEGRVMRGGSWIHVGRYLRSAYRYHDDPAYRDNHIGFRFVGGPVKEEEAAFPFRQRTDAERRA